MKDFVNVRFVYSKRAFPWHLLLDYNLKKTLTLSCFSMNYSDFSAYNVYPNIYSQPENTWSHVGVHVHTHTHTHTHFLFNFRTALTISRRKIYFCLLISSNYCSSKLFFGGWGCGNLQLHRGKIWWFCLSIFYYQDSISCLRSDI